MTTLDKFAAGMKAKLRKVERYDLVDLSVHDYGGETGCSVTFEINWAELDHQIDEFCAEFKKAEAKPQ